MRLAKAVTRLCVCGGWSDPLLVAHSTLLEISCHGSYAKDIAQRCYFQDKTMAGKELMLCLCYSLTNESSRILNLTMKEISFLRPLSLKISCINWPECEKSVMLI